MLRIGKNFVKCLSLPIYLNITLYKSPSQAFITLVYGKNVQ